MKLYEYQGRELFEKLGVPTPKGFVVSSVAELESRKADIHYPAVLKAQVLTGGRGKAGGIQFVNDFAEAHAKAAAIIGMKIKTYTVEKIFVVEKLDFAKEYYLSVFLDRETRTPLVMFSTKGGVDIESVPDADLRRVHVHPFTGFQPFHARVLFGGLGLEPAIQKQIEAICATLVAAWHKADAELLEINPLAVTGDGKVLAADAKVLLDDDAHFRHVEYEEPAEDKTPLEREAEEKDIAFVQLDGDIGVIANGAGLTMATLDALTHYGGRPGVFLDLGGTDDPEKVRTCVLLMRKAAPRVMLLNLFGGITKSDTVAKGLKLVLDTEKIDFPIVTRIKGVNEEEARAILKEAGLVTATTLQHAAEVTVRIARAVDPSAEAAKAAKEVQS
ncbi:MAG: ADP-forming succinate--CoA ligase subunit beta [Thermoplasmatota archaeon]